MNCKVTSWSPSLLVENSPPHSQTHKCTMCNSHIAAVSGKQEGTLMHRTWIVLCLTSSPQSHLFYKLIFPKGHQKTLIISMAVAWNREPPVAGMDHNGGGDGGSMTNGGNDGCRKACSHSTRLKAEHQHLPFGKLPLKRLHTGHFHSSCGHC